MAHESGKKYVVGIGEALWDMLPDGKKLGGAPANFAYHVSQFGFPTCVASAIGRDVLGTELTAEFKARDINALLPLTDYPTGTVSVELDALGIPAYDITRDVAWDHIPFTDSLRELAADTQAVSFGSLAQRNATSRDTIYHFLDSMPDTPDTYKIFDINLRQDFYSPEIIHQSISRCNILKINDEELVEITRLFNLPGSDIKDICIGLLHRYQLSILILTCGVNGSYVFTPDEISFMETPRITVADTVGAGDSFTATFTASLLAGKPIAEAHRLAVDVSAFVCTQAGA
ncbi:MAG: carbohydrate kinase, partial [Paramuribaculum sp.]|nr:carbohydrate kinase [Paramuribaculum sp.]